MSTHEKKKSCPLSTVDPASKSLQKPQFQVCSFFSGLRVQHVEVKLRAGRGQRQCYGCGIENEARGSSADWPAPADIAECCHQIQVSELPLLAVADSKAKKKFRAFSGDPAMRSCVLANNVALEWWQLSLSPSHSNILDVTRPQANNDSVCVSLCAGQVLFDTVYLLVE